MKLKELISQAFPEHPQIPVLPDLEVSGIETDSRAVKKGFIFIAVHGAKKDGHDFIPQALSNGASVLVVDKKISIVSDVSLVEIPDARAASARLAAIFYGKPSEFMSVIGITGTNGKTTSSYLLEHLLSMEQKKTGVIGTISYRFGGQEIPAVETTPGPLKIQFMLSGMKEARCEYVVMEASSHALDQKRVAEIDFSVALFTNLTQDHLDYHGSMEAYFEAKARLFTELLPGKIAAINVDDEWGRKLPAKTKAKALTYGILGPADFRAENIIYHADSSEWNLVHGGKKIKIFSPLAGRHNVYNVLGAFAVLGGLGFSLEKAAQNLKSFAGVPGRLEPVRSGQSFQVFVDFAHTPDGLLNVLRALQDLRKKKLFVVFGCGGDRDKNKRPKMGRIASEYSDFVYVTSDNPRSENPKTIAEEICAGFPANFKNYSVVIDRHKAIRQALLSAREGDIVLLAGKGHERTQIIGNQNQPFNDREEAERVLNGY